MAEGEISGSVVCGIGSRAVGRRLAACAAGIAKPLGAPLSTVRVESAVPGRVERGYALLADVARGAELEHPVRRRVEVGEPAHTLIAIAAHESAQLLVVGAGTPTKPTAPLGSIWPELVVRASCPVVVVPQAAVSPRPDSWTRGLVLCAFDGTDHARAALSVAATVAERLGGAAYVAHVGHGSAGELEARARSQRAALIVASSLGGEGWQAAMPGSAPARLATSGPVPVLFVPPAYRPAPAFRSGWLRPVEPVERKPETPLLT